MLHRIVHWLREIQRKRMLNQTRKKLDSMKWKPWSTGTEEFVDIGGGWHIEKKTYDLIQNEPIPAVEQDDHDHNFIRVEMPQTQVKGVVWHPRHPQLFSVHLDETDTVKVTAYNFASLQLVKQFEIALEVPSGTESFQLVMHHPRVAYLLFVFDAYLVIWDYENNRKVAELTTEHMYRDGGFYPDQEQVWLAVKVFSGSVHWGIWNYSHGGYEVFPLEHEDHYGRGATLHPSGLLIAALWNAYECGYYMHDAVPDGGNLYFYRQPAPERPEYEAYEPCVSPDGKSLAFIANPYLMLHQNYSKVCIYDIETAELVREFATGHRDGEVQLQYAFGGRTLSFFAKQTSEELLVYNAQNGKRLSALTIPAKFERFSAHPSFGYYAVGHAEGLSVFYDMNDHVPDEVSEATKIANGVAKQFMIDNAQHRETVGLY